MNIGCTSFEHFRVLVDQTGNLSNKLINDIIFSFHLFPP